MLAPFRAASRVPVFQFPTDTEWLCGLDGRAVRGWTSTEEIITGYRFGGWSRNVNAWINRAGCWGTHGKPCPMGSDWRSVAEGCTRRWPAWRIGRSPRMTNW